MNEPSNWNITIETRRGGYLESLSRVRAVVMDASGRIVMQAGDMEEPVFWRSTAKFVQALSLFRSGAVDRFGFSDEELALACGSHSGGPQHVALAQKMLDRLGLSPSALHCGPHIPLGPDEAAQLAASHKEPTQLHNNCSGKHSGMLACCLARGWSLTDYNRHHHPLQQEILAHLSSVSGIDPTHIQTAIDGCGAVVFRTPLHGLARAYARLAGDALPAPHQEAGRRIRQAIAAAPEMVAGPGRLCTDLMKVSRHNLVAKIGADGVYGLAAISSPQGPCGLAVKIEDGSMKLLGPLVCQLAAALGWLDEHQLEQLRPHFYQPIINHQKELVGDVHVSIDS